MRLDFDPYEGNEKYIFVSYSHINDDRVGPVLEYLNKYGFRIWYDEGIEWGTEWPEAIAEHLRNCEVCVAFLSKDSVVSPNCRREINYAIKMNKGILSVYLEEVELSEGMDMQLSPFQSTYPYQYEDKDKFFSRLIETKILQSCRAEAAPRVKAPASRKTVDSWSFDQDLNASMKKALESPAAQSPLEKKIADARARNFMKAFAEKAKVARAPEEDAPGDASEERSFTLPDLPGFKTLVFIVRKVADYKTLTGMYITEPVESVPQDSNDDAVKETCYHCHFDKGGNPLVFIHFNYERKEVEVNTGFLNDDSVGISKTPMPMTWQEVTMEDRHNINSSAYDLDSLTEEEKKMFTAGKQKDEKRWAEAVIDDPVCILIDMETAETVKRKIYYDAAAGAWKAKIQFVPGKKYFAFQLNSDKSGSSVWPLTDHEIAEYYLNGEYGFPQDIVKAVSYFEKDGSAQSYHEIADIFKNDDALRDAELYQEYLKKAEELENM